MTKQQDPLATRRRYTSQDAGLDSPPQDPFKLFENWLQAAAANAAIREPNAMHLATAGANGRPHGRLVLLRGLTAPDHASPQPQPPAFVFYTHYESAKARQLAANNWAALTFWWEPLARQVRVEGQVAKIAETASDAYFATRPLGHRLGAWASPQSRVLLHPRVLTKRLTNIKAQFPGDEVPRPSYWGGYALGAHLFEFWQGRPDRLHQRLRYRQQEGGWQLDYLAP